MKTKIGIIFGGESVEHEISIISAYQAMRNINRGMYDIVPIYLGKNRHWYCGKVLNTIDIFKKKDLDDIMKRIERVHLVEDEGIFYLNFHKKKGYYDIIDIAFPIVHGTNAEDGSLQGLLEHVGIPYVGCNVAAAAVGQDKVFMKNILRDCRVPIVDYLWFYDIDWHESPNDITDRASKLGYPLVVKPASLGSSVGVQKVFGLFQLRDAIEYAINFDRKILVEQAVKNLREINCSVLGDYEHIELSELEEVFPGDNILSYSDKYTNKSSDESQGMVETNREIPANISSRVREKIEEYSATCFEVIGASGVARIDFLVNDETEEVYVNEINTIPGSLAHYLWEGKGYTYKNLLERLIRLAIKRKQRRDIKVYSHNSNVLKQSGKIFK